MENINSKEVTLADLIKLVVGKIWLILAISAACAIGAFAVVKFVVKPDYAASVSVLIDYSGTETSASTQVSVSKSIVANCVEIISANKFYSELADRVNTAESSLNVNSHQLEGAITYNTSTNTSVIAAAIKTKNQLLSKTIATSMSSLLQTYIGTTYNLADGNIAVSIINDPTVVTEAKASSVLFGAIGFVVGLICSVVVLMIIQANDTRVKSEDELIERYNKPILGAVPCFNYDNANGGEKSNG